MWLLRCNYGSSLKTINFQHRLPVAIVFGWLSLVDFCRRRFYFQWHHLKWSSSLILILFEIMYKLDVFANGVFSVFSFYFKLTVLSLRFYRFILQILSFSWPFLNYCPFSTKRAVKCKSNSSNKILKTGLLCFHLWCYTGYNSFGDNLYSKSFWLK